MLLSKPLYLPLRAALEWAGTNGFSHHLMLQHVVGLLTFPLTHGFAVLAVALVRRRQKDRTYLPLASKLQIWERCARRLQRLGFEPPAGTTTSDAGQDSQPQPPPGPGDEPTDGSDRRQFGGAGLFDGLRDAAVRMPGGIAGAVGVARKGGATRRAGTPGLGAGGIAGRMRGVWMPGH